MASAGTVDDKETILRLYFLVPLLDAVLCSIKCRFSKQATEFMTRITAFSPENWVNEADEKSKIFTDSVRCLAAYYSLEASAVVAQYNLFISPKDDAGHENVNERTERSKCKNLARLLEYMNKLSQVYTANCINCLRYVQPFQLRLHAMNAHTAN